MKKTLALVLSLVLTVVCALPAFASDGATCVTVNGEAKNLIAYNIAGNNYFKLRDLGEFLDFYVGWDGINKVISIDTSRSYNG